MPLHYQGILDEHKAIRERVGVFDISHMGEVRISGPGACDWLNGLLSNQLERLGVSEGQYTFLLNERGGVIDDLIVFRSTEDTYFLVVNAAKIDEDMAWFEDKRIDGVTIVDLSESMGGLAVQGPRAAHLAESLAGADESLPARNNLVTWLGPEGDAWITRTGYTGEDGFELFAPNAAMMHWWERILKLGALPCGLGARDLLRLEMGYPLNGADLAPDRTPLEAGLGFFVDLDKEVLPGKDILLEQKRIGPAQKLTGFQMEGKAPPPRSGYSIFDGDQEIGTITSGALSPALKAGIGMAYLPSTHARSGIEIAVEIRGRKFPARTLKKPFYRKDKHPS